MQHTRNQLFSIKCNFQDCKSATFETLHTKNNELITIWLSLWQPLPFCPATQSQLNTFLMMHFRQLHIEFHGVAHSPPTYTRSNKCKAIEILIECAMSCHIINWWGHVQCFYFLVGNSNCMLNEERQIANAFQNENMQMHKHTHTGKMPQPHPIFH